LALYQQRTLLAQIQWISARRHSEQLLPQLDALCHLANITPHKSPLSPSVSGQVVGVGYASGFSLAKGLVLANDAQIIGISALDVTRLAMASYSGSDRLPRSWARALCGGTYHQTMWQPGQIQPQNIALDQLGSIATTTICCTELVWEQIQATLPPYITHIAPHTPPAFIAQIALHTGVDLTAVIEPLYLGEAVITQK
jgi:tRNA A37 threonylcarbamoyladenosine modification protein TsaB